MTPPSLVVTKLSNATDTPVEDSESMSVTTARLPAAMIPPDAKAGAPFKATVEGVYDNIDAEGADITVKAFKAAGGGMVMTPNDENESPLESNFDRWNSSGR